MPEGISPNAKVCNEHVGGKTARQRMITFQIRSGHKSSIARMSQHQAPKAARGANGQQRRVQRTRNARCSVQMVITPVTAGGRRICGNLKGAQTGISCAEQHRQLDVVERIAATIGRLPVRCCCALHIARCAQHNNGHIYTWVGGRYQRICSHRQSRTRRA